MTSRRSGSEREDLCSLIINRNLHIAIGVLLSLQIVQRGLYLDKKPTALRQSTFILTQGKGQLLGRHERGRHAMHPYRDCLVETVVVGHFFQIV